MNFKRTILFKSVTALFFVLLFVSISTIQVAHTHALQDEASTQKKHGDFNFYNLTKEGKCFICDFQLAKDADHCFFTTQILSPNYHSVKTNFLKIDFNFCLNSFVENRGPPTCTIV